MKWSEKHSKWIMIWSILNNWILFLIILVISLLFSFYSFLSFLFNLYINNILNRMVLIEFNHYNHELIWYWWMCMIWYDELELIEMDYWIITYSILSSISLIDNGFDKWFYVIFDNMDLNESSCTIFNHLLWNHFNLLFFEVIDDDSIFSIESYWFIQCFQFYQYQYD